MNKWYKIDGYFGCCMYRYFGRFHQLVLSNYRIHLNLNWKYHIFAFFSYNKIWHLKRHNQIWLKLTLAYLFPKGITVKFCFGKYEHKIPVFGWMIGFKAGFVCMLWRNENKRKEFWEIGYISCYYFSLRACYAKNVWQVITQ